MQVTILTLDNTNSCRGFTLIELLVALVILMVGMMGLISATATAVDLNIRNQIFDEALQIADERMRLVKANGTATFAAPFAGVSTSVVRNSRLRAKQTLYTIQLEATAAGDSSNVLRSVVSWVYKNKTYNQDITSMKQYH